MARRHTQRSTLPRRGARDRHGAAARFSRYGQAQALALRDLDEHGKVSDGEVDRQIERLERLLRSTAKNDRISYLLPWLLHLVADIHQPLHVGRHGDEGGNAVEIENPFNKRVPFSSLHLYWDDLPGPPWLRGKALEKRTQHLIDTYRRGARQRRALAQRKPRPARRRLPRDGRQPVADHYRGLQPESARSPTGASSMPATVSAGCSKPLSLRAFHVKRNRIAA
ncbi:MAG: hypothetical protein HT580_14580 [Dechloromonas sp.]|nr:MAG: hypothetical protein HT580_14580 [Dechloromonas sp.]